MPIKPLNILLIDDDKEELTAFDHALSKLDLSYKLSYYYNGMDGVMQFIHQKQPNLIFLDINMPGKKGIQLLQELKANPALNQIPVVMYSVSISESDIEKSYAAGAHYYLVKPYAEANLAAVLRKILKADWTKPQPRPDLDNFVVNLTFA